MTEWEIVDDITTYTYDGAIDETILTTEVNTEQTLTLRHDTTGESGANIDKLLSWIKYSDHVHYGTKNDGTPWYHENPPTIGASTNFVRINPPANIPLEDFWAVIENGEDQTPGYGTPRIVSLSIVYLGSTSDYADRATAKAALEA